VDTRFPEQWSQLRVALAHDWLTGMRGGEKVLELLCRGFPEAPLFTLIHKRAAISEPINRHAVTTSWLQHAPGINATYRYYLPLFPLAVSGLRPGPADLLISTSHCVAKAVRPAPGCRHLCYCFTPMRYAWTFYTEYFGRNALKQLLVKPVLASLRRWDRRASRRVDLFVAISEHIRKRIQRFYGRDADVVYPPVDTGFYTPAPGAGAGQYDLVVSALVPYKRVDLAVRAYRDIDFPLKVIGVGTEMETLRKQAGPKTSFLGWQTDESIRDHYRNCRCLVFPGEEDFGIVPVEAQACGRPVVAYACGGALETVRDGLSGVQFRHQTERDLREAVEACAAKPWNPAAIREHAETFSIQRFLDGLDACIRKLPA
jgi:glycosyltransferase involved in cell wall biosynthesis